MEKEKNDKVKRIIFNVLKLLLVFILFYYSSFLQYIPVYLFKIKTPISGATSVLLSSFSNLVLVIILFLIYRKELIKEFKKFKNHFVEDVDVGIKSWFIGLIIIFICNAILIHFTSGQSKNEQLVQEMISALPWVMLIDAGILGPFIEEIIFRKAIRDVIENKYIFIVISGLVFGLMHVITSFDSLGTFLFFIPYTALGIAFAYAYQKTNTIFTSIFVHMMHNTILILLSILPTLLK